MAQQLRSQVSSEDTWDLSPMYASEEAWEQDLVATEARLEELESWSGKLSNSAQELADALQCYLDIGRAVERIYVFAHLRSDEDTANSDHLAGFQKAARLYTLFASSSSYINPEILRIPEAEMNALLEAPVLKPMRRMLEKISKYRPHTLDAEQEALIAAASEVFSASSSIFSQLNNADFNFGEIEVNAERLPLTHASYSTFLKNKDPEIRKKAYQQYYATFDEHKNTLAATLTSSVKKDVYLSRIKHFPSAVEASLFSDDISLDVYTNLIDTVSKALPALHDYYELRKERSAKSTLHLYDTYVPLVESVECTHSYEQAAELVCESVAILGEDYQKPLRAGLLENRWVDRYENKGKRSGAYSSGCYDSPPYILMNFNDSDLRDVFTLTHEAGHSMHTYFSNATQPFQDAHYTIFVAEVASTFNEQLLMKRLREKYADDPHMSAYLINHQLDDIKSTLYRQTMFAEFELFTHQQEEQGAPLTVDSYRAFYQTLLEKYFGKAVSFEEIDSLECFRIPHFYSAFYVYKYATGLAAAISLSQQVLQGGAAERDRYLTFLKAGGSKYPLEVLADAGVDMRSSEAIVESTKLFEQLVAELRVELAKLEQ